MKKELSKIYNTATCNGMREMTEERFIQAAEEYAQNYYFSKVKKYSAVANIGRYTLRLFGLPFFTMIALGYSAYLFLRFVICFIRFGGEAIAYSKYVNYKTITGVYEKVDELLKRKQ